MDPVEQIIGHPFSNPQLVADALTHGSLSYEGQRTQTDNQRLEFLGDAVLELILSHKLFTRLPDADEGVLTQARAQLVSTKSLAALAREIGIAAHIRMGRGEEANGGRDRESTLADTLEAVIGAVYVDGGYDAAECLVGRLFDAALTAIESGPIGQNPKGRLQEILQEIGDMAPSYEIIGQSGPDHARSFEATVSWDGELLGRGAGRSKKDAEVRAAQAALDDSGFEGRLAHLRAQSGKAR